MADKSKALALIEDKKDEIVQALSQNVDRDRFMRIVLSEFTNNPDLNKCKPETVLTSIIGSAQLGLEVGKTLGHAYLIPYKQDCTLIIGYKGLLELALRDPSVTDIYAQVVYENDRFEHQLGTDPKLVHIPAPLGEERGAKIGAYAVCRKTDGTTHFEIMDKGEIEKIKRKTQGGGTRGPWKEYEDEMWRKTVIRRLVKYMRLLPVEAFETLAKEDEKEFGRTTTTREQGSFDVGAFSASQEPNRGHDETGFEPPEEREAEVTDPEPEPEPDTGFGGEPETEEEEETGELMSDAQHKKIRAIIRNLGMADAKCKGIIAGMVYDSIGREATSKDMTMREASKFIEFLEKQEEIQKARG